MKVTLNSLIQLGLLRDNQQLTLFRRGGTIHSANITADGHIKTADGIIHSSLSSAARHYLGRPVDGWTVWRLENGQKIDSIRKTIGLAK